MKGEEALRIHKWASATYKKSKSNISHNHLGLIAFTLTNFHQFLKGITCKNVNSEPSVILNVTKDIWGF